MSRIRLTFVAALVALFALAVVAAGCGSDDDTSSTSAASSTDTGTTATADVSTINEGTLLIGTDAPYPPFEIGTPDDADFSGYDIDLANDIADPASKSWMSVYFVGFVIMSL